MPDPSRNHDRRRGSNLRYLPIQFEPIAQAAVSGPQNVDFIIVVNVHIGVVCPSARCHGNGITNDVESHMER